MTGTRRDTDETPGAVKIVQLPSGVPGLDEILGGGIPELSFNLIAGVPGSGKTVLAHQIAFANGSVERPALYFTMLGEPLIKVLRYQQKFSFFDPTKLGQAVQFISLSDMILDLDLNAVLKLIIDRATAANAGVIVLDSFRILTHRTAGGLSYPDVRSFIFRLGQFVSAVSGTAFLVGEYDDHEVRDEPVFGMVDGIIWLSQVTERNSVVRKLHVSKFRGQATIPGRHTMRITNDGLQTFSRTLGVERVTTLRSRHHRLALGITELDRMMGGGIFEGDSVLIAGPSGTGKSALATQFIAEGVGRGEPAVVAIFEERPANYADRAEGFGLKLNKAEAKGLLEILYHRPLDLSVEETVQAILEAVERVGAKRLVIDSLAGFEMALAPGFRPDFRESLYRMIGVLTGAGITVLSTVEVEDNFTSLQFSHYAVSFLTDDIIRLRYVEIDGALHRTLVVIKMRGSAHSKEIREYTITDKGIVILDPTLTDYEHLITGIPRLRPETNRK